MSYVHRVCIWAFISTTVTFLVYRVSLYTNNVCTCTHHLHKYMYNGSWLSVCRFLLLQMSFQVYTFTGALVMITISLHWVHGWMQHVSQNFTQFVRMFFSAIILPASNISTCWKGLQFGGKHMHSPKLCFLKTRTLHHSLHAFTHVEMNNSFLFSKHFISKSLCGTVYC